MWFFRRSLCLFGVGGRFIIIPVLCVSFLVILVVCLSLPSAARLMIDTTTAICIFLRKVDEVLIAEAAFRLRPRCHWLGWRLREVGLLAGQDFLAIEVTAIGDGMELFCVQRRLCRLRHARKL